MKLTFQVLCEVLWFIVIASICTSCDQNVKAAPVPVTQDSVSPPASVPGAATPAETHQKTGSKPTSAATPPVVPSVPKTDNGPLGSPASPSAQEPTASQPTTTPAPTKPQTPKLSKAELAAIAKANQSVVGKWVETAEGKQGGAKYQFNADGTGIGYTEFSIARGVPIKIHFNYAVQAGQLLQRATSAEAAVQKGDMKQVQQLVDGLNKSFKSPVYQLQTRPRQMTWIDKNTFTLPSNYGPVNKFKRENWSAP